MANFFTSCPSTGPKYLKFNDSKRFAFFNRVPLMLFSSFLTIPRAFGPTSEILVNTAAISSRNLLYRFDVVILVKYSFSAPTLGSMDIQLSFKITNRLDLEIPAWFNASNDIPPVKAPSPITAICCLSFSPFIWEATAIPKAAEIDVEECPTPKASYSDSKRLGKPEIPFSMRFV
ncbi:hypothetical protein D3C86_924530 [compost metagenome]